MNINSNNANTNTFVTMDRGVKEAECAELTGVSRSFRWKLEKHGRFPKRRRISSRSHFWLLSEIISWLQCPEDYKTNS